MRKAAVAASILVASCTYPPPQGQGLLQCLAPDVVDGLLRSSSVIVDVEIGADMPAPLADIAMPDDLQWIGAWTRSSVAMGAFKSGADTAAAFNSALGSLEDAGWETSGRARSAAVAFADTSNGASLSPAPALLTGRACRDDRSVGVTVRKVEEATYVAYTVNSAPGLLPCGARNSYSEMIDLIRTNAIFPPDSDLARFFTDIEFPIDPSTGRTAQTTGEGRQGYPRSQSADVLVVVSLPIADLARHFYSEFLRNGWTADASWTGRTTAGSSWSRETETGERVMAVLSIAARGLTNYNVQFRVTRLDETREYR